jgi:CheY-like chemotaxis protein
MDGIEASKRIKNHNGLSKIPPIILVTAYGREELMRQADKIGLEGFLLKPVNSSMLLDAIMQALGKEVQDVSQVGRKKEQRAEELNTIYGARVLLVEDNEINQQVALEILQGAGLNVTVANNGQEGVDAAKKKQYDAILMDIQMPVMDGYTASREIRNLQSEIRKVPIIAMTAHAMAGDEQKSIEAGMNDHVTKPIDPDQLFATLQRWVKPIAERAAVQKPPVLDIPPESDQALLDEDEIPESLPGFDMAAGLKRLGGNKRLYRKLLLDFGANYSCVAGEIQETLEAKDFEQAHSLVHNLNGLAGNLEATDLQTAAVEMEKLVKGQTAKTTSDKELNWKFAKLENALNQALESVQSIGASAEENVCKLSDEEIAAIPSEFAQDIAKRIRNAAEMGDVMTLIAIAEEMKTHSDSCTPLSKQIIQLAEDFDFEGILKLASELTS